MTKDSYAYNASDDFSVFRKGSCQFGKIQVSIEACTVAGTKDGRARKPNEDAFSVREEESVLDAAVFDGCSSQKPISFLTDQTGARFASHFLKQTFEKHHDGQPTEQIRILNAKLFASSSSHSGVTVRDVHTLPASTATIVHFDFSTQTYTLNHVGDTFCVVFYTDGSSDFITEDRNKKFDEETFALIRSIAKEKKCTPREAKQDIRVKQAIVTMFQATHNKADGTGQGILNGDKQMEQYIQTAIFPLSKVKAVLLGSDGLVPPGWDMQSSTDREKIFVLLKKGGIKEVILRKQQIENDDPDWLLTRYKHSDDATGIYLTLHV